MSRPLRIEVAGALYHVTSYGDGREAIFLGEEDWHLFLSVIAEIVQDFNWAVPFEKSLSPTAGATEIVSADRRGA
jgi:REP element-mobilizing transposase RayT